jgi:hypothetical protein
LNIKRFGKRKRDLGREFEILEQDGVIWFQELIWSKTVTGGVLRAEKGEEEIKPHENIEMQVLISRMTKTKTLKKTILLLIRRPLEMRPEWES